MRKLSSDSYSNSISTILSNVKANKKAIQFVANGNASESTYNESASNDNVHKLYFTQDGIVLGGYLIGESLPADYYNWVTSGIHTLVKSNSGALTLTGTSITIDAPVTVPSTKAFKYGTDTVATQNWVSNAISEANAQGGYSLPTASTATKGGIKVDGTTFTVNSSNDLITLTGYSVTAGTGNTRNITIAGTTTTLSGNSVHIPTATYVGNTVNEDNKIVKKSDLSSYATTNALSSYATTNWTTSQLEDIHDEAVAAQNAANNAVLKWS